MGFVHSVLVYIKLLPIRMIAVTFLNLKKIIGVIMKNKMYPIIVIDAKEKRYQRYVNGVFHFSIVSKERLLDAYEVEVIRTNPEKYYII